MAAPVQKSKRSLSAAQYDALLSEIALHDHLPLIAGDEPDPAEALAALRAAQDREMLAAEPIEGPEETATSTDTASDATPSKAETEAEHISPPEAKAQAEAQSQPVETHAATGDDGAEGAPETDETEDETAVAPKADKAPSTRLDDRRLLATLRRARTDRAAARAATERAETAEAELADLRRNAAHADEESRQAAETEEEVAEARKALISAADEITDLQTARTEAEETLAVRDAERADLATRLEAATAEAAALREAADRAADTNRRADEADARHAEADAARQDVAARLDAAETARQAAEGRAEAARSAEEAARRDAEAGQARLSQLEADLAQARSDLAAARSASRAPRPAPLRLTPAARTDTPAQADEPDPPAPEATIDGPMPTRPQTPDTAQPSTATTDLAPVTRQQATSDAWRALASVTLDPLRLERNLIISARRRDPAHAAFDVLRTRLIQALADRGWRHVGITSPTRGCGKSFVAANLALALARYDECRTVLMEADLRHSSLARLLGVPASHNVADLLRGRVPARDLLRRIDGRKLHIGPNLAVGLNRESEAYAAEVFHDEASATALRQMTEMYGPDVVLHDLPPALAGDDVLAFKPHLDCVLLVVAGGLTTAAQVREVTRLLGDETPVLGIVLNKADDAPDYTY